MTFQESIKTCLGKYATFSGRASRSEYWYFFLFQLIVLVAANLLDGMLGTRSTFAGQGSVYIHSYGYIYSLCGLLLLLPSLAASVRRLHDRDKSGWWLLITLLPLIGGIIFLVWIVQKGTDGQNRFGPDPLARA